MSWQLQHAKNRLSEVLRRAQEQGPQVITVRGQEAAVVLSVADYRRLERPADSLVAFMAASPWAEAELDIERGADSGREIEL